MKQFVIMNVQQERKCMFIVKDKNSKEVIAICSRRKDAFAYFNSNVENITYIIEEVKK